MNKEIVINAELTPTKFIFKSTNEDGSTFSVISCSVGKSDKDLELHPIYKNITITGYGLEDVMLNRQQKFKLTPVKNKHQSSYNARLDIPEIDLNPKNQWSFLEFCVTENQFLEFQKTYDENIKIIDYIVSLDNTKDIINSVYGIGDSTLSKIRDKIDLKMNISKILVMFDGFAVPEHVVNKIYNHYSSNMSLLEKIFKENIYELTKISGIGFKTIDAIYLSHENSNVEDENRVKAGILYALSEQMSNGNTKYKKSKLINSSIRALGVKKNVVVKVLEDIIIDGSSLIKNIDRTIDYNNLSKIIPRILTNEKAYDKIVLYNDFYSLSEVFVCEYITFKILLKKSECEPLTPRFDKGIFDYFKNFENIELSDEQQKFFLELNNSSLQFLVANGGTGKSMSQKVLLKYANDNNLKVLLLAPTGKARKKLEEYTNHKAHTIHSFLQIRDEIDITNTVLQGVNNFDIVVIDESSMIDTKLAYSLISYFPVETKMIFVGDDAQIPSVSYGNFLFDTTHDTTSLHVSRFSKVFRQNEGGILDIITKIRKGERFLKSTFFGRKVFGKNCVFNTRLEYGQEYSDNAIDTYVNLLDSGYTINDIVILTPSNIGINGTVEINKKIQSRINKSKGNFLIVSNSQGNDIHFKVGDLLMNVRNKYVYDVTHTHGVITESSEKSVYVANGESMILKEVLNQYCIFEFESRLIAIYNDEIKNGDMQHGWCITAHKSQGSEYKIAICIVPTQSSFQMNGNLLYTMTSRAKDYLLVLGDMNVINRSMSKFENYRRETNLKTFFEIYEGRYE